MPEINPTDERLDALDGRLDVLERAAPRAGEVAVPGVGMVTSGAARWVFGAVLAVLAGAATWFWSDRQELLRTIEGLKTEASAQTRLLAELREEMKALRLDLSSEMRRVTPKDLRLCVEAVYDDDAPGLERCRLLLAAKEYAERPGS